MTCLVTADVNNAPSFHMRIIIDWKFFCYIKMKNSGKYPWNYERLVYTIPVRDY